MPSRRAETKPAASMYRFDVHHDDDIIDQEIIYAMTDAFTKFMGTLENGIDKKPDFENRS